MDSFKNDEIEEIIEEETVEETTTDPTDEVEEVAEVSDDEADAADETDSIEEDAAMPSGSVAQSRQAGSVTSARSKSDKMKKGSKVTTSKESPKYKGLYKSVNGGAVVPEPVKAVGTAESKEKQMQLLDKKRSTVEDVKVHMDAMFNGEELSETFRSKAELIFTTAINERLEVVESEIKEQYETNLIEQVEGIKTELTEQLDSYLSYVIEEWIEENRLVVEKGLRTEIAEEFMEGLRQLFINNNISVPEGKTDILDEMANTVEELTTSLNGELNKTIELKNKVGQLERKQLLGVVSEGLAETDKERFVKLAEGVSFNDNTDYQEKISTIRESYFSTSGKSFLSEEAAEDDLDSAEQAPTETEDTLSESMEIYSQALSRLSKSKRKTN